jgi:hypothetical protein
MQAKGIASFITRVRHLNLKGRKNVKKKVFRWILSRAGTIYLFFSFLCLTIVFFYINIYYNTIIGTKILYMESLCLKMLMGSKSLELNPDEKWNRVWPHDKKWFTGTINTDIYFTCICLTLNIWFIYIKSTSLILNYSFQFEFEIRDKKKQRRQNNICW